MRYGRRTPLLHHLLLTLALALAGRAGARMAATLAVPVSRVTLISILMAPPDPPATSSARCPQVPGVDDFAFRKGKAYGTVLVDVDASTVIDLLPDRSSGTPHRVARRAPRCRGHLPRQQIQPRRDHGLPESGPNR